MKYFIQTSGTAIGTKLAPGYASLLLSTYERDMLNQYPIKPSIWLRYVDDIFMVWNEREDKLKDFLAYINTVIQFTHAHSFRGVNFLVVVVVVDPTPPTCCQQSPAPESCGSQQSLPPDGKERLHFVGIRPEVQARKGCW